MAGGWTSQTELAIGCIVPLRTNRSHADAIRLTRLRGFAWGPVFPGRAIG
jgi:hypothetical protein